MPDLTLDEFRGLTEEQLKRVLIKEVLTAGFKQMCSQDAKDSITNSSCGNSRTAKTS